MKPFRNADALALILAFLFVFSVGIRLLADTRQKSAATLCKDRMRDIAIACTSYHSNFRLLPMGASSQKFAVAEQERDISISGFASLLPSVNEQAIFNELQLEISRGKPIARSLRDRSLDCFKCPADPNAVQVNGSRSYAFSFGDALQLADPSLSEVDRAKASRGLFAIGVQFAFDDIKDGRSNTILFSETAIGTAERKSNERVLKDLDGLLRARTPLVVSLDPTKPTHFSVEAMLWREGKGASWLDGEFRIGGFSTAIWPNMPSATGPSMKTAVMSASSHHPGGVHVCFADNSVRFIADSIEAGGFSASSLSLEELGNNTKSTYGLWGSAGARSDGAPTRAK